MTRRQRLTGPRSSEGRPAAKLTVANSSIDGRGCFAAAPFRAGQVVAEYIGEKVSRAEAARRRRGRRRYSLCALDAEWAVDGRAGGNATQYINHSCDPNCEAEVVDGRILIRARRDVSAGEEITVDYQSSYHSDRKRCWCQSGNCRGTINQPARDAQPTPAPDRGRKPDYDLALDASAAKNGAG